MPSVTVPLSENAYNAFNVSFIDGNSTSSIVPSVVDDVETRPEYFEAIGYAGLMIAAMAANIFAISTILRTKTLRKNDHNLLILNLNIMDLGITLLSMSFSVGSFFDGGAYLKDNYALCRLNGFFAMTFTVGNFTTTLCIAIDRYLTVVCSTRFPPNRRRILILLAYSWIVAIFFSSMPTFEVAAKFVYTRATHHCSPSWSSCGYFIAWFTHIYGITVPIMILCYFFVFRAIRQKENKLKQYGLKNSGSGAAMKGSSSAGSQVGGGYLDEGRKSSELPSASGDSATESEARGVRIKAPVCALDSTNSFGVPVYAQRESEPESGVYSQDPSSTAATDEKGTTTVSNDQLRAPREAKRNGQFRLSMRKDLGVKFTLGNGSASGTDLDSDDQGLSADGEVKKRKAKKEKRRRLKLQNLSIDKQVALTGVMLVLTTVICWTPYNIIHSCFFNIDLSHPIDALTMWIGYLNALLDPLIYTFMNRKARAAGSERTRHIRNALADMRDRSSDRLYRVRVRVSESLSTLFQRTD